MLSKYHHSWTRPYVLEKIILENTDSTIRTTTQIRYQSYDYQYIQKSIVPTMHFQRSLPRLPVPDLKLTCQRYLKAQQPLLIKNDYLKTKENVEHFEQNDGIILQDMLKKKNDLDKNTSYITKDWFNMYLSDRSPLPINYNPLLVFKQSDNEYGNQLLRSTNLLISSLRFYKSLKANLLEPEIFHINPKKSDTPQFRKIMKYLPESISWYGAYMHNAYPLDMSQYSSLFNNTRIPMINKDILHSSKSGKHIVVMRRGHFYKFDVLDDQGNILEPKLLLSKLQYILKNDIIPCDHPIGVLTTTERNNWANLREYLIKLGNEESLSIIDDSLMMIALDDEKPGADPISCVRQYLHSDGINRWFDKSFTLIVCADGTSGLNFEHSWGDGVAVLRYFQDISKDSTDFPRCHPENLNQNFNSDSLDVKILEFNLDDKMKRDIKKTMNEYKHTYESLDINYFELFDVGRKMCKKYGISADSLMQLCFQLGHYKLHKKHVATYESCSTSAFKQGRTETVRPCTKETSDFCHAVCSSNKPSNGDLVNMIKQCSVAHSKLVKDAAMGQGFDRHLFALLLLAKENDLNIPDLFTDSAYGQLNHNILSTSSLTSDYVYLGGFGPVVKDGYGIGYTILEEYSGAIITNYKEHSDGDKFKNALTQSLNQVLDILKS